MLLDFAIKRSTNFSVIVIVKLQLSSMLLVLARKSPTNFSVIVIVKLQKHETSFNYLPGQLCSVCSGMARVRLLVTRTAGFSGNSPSSLDGSP